MKITQNFIVLFLFLCVFTVNAQTYNKPSSTHIGFQENASELSFLSSQNSQNGFRSATSLGSDVFISQIGTNNNSIIQTKSNATDLNVVQNGSNNDLYYQVSANTIKGSIIQNGNNNSIFHTNPFEIKSHEAQILQNGNSQNVEWSGNNSVSEKMKLSMQGNNQTIIVRNLN